MAKKNSLATVPKNNQKLPSSEVLEERRQELVVMAVDAMPEVMQTVIAMAKDGDMDAIKLLARIAGLDLNGGGNRQVNNAIQINITPEEQAQLERDWAEGIVD
ncbi:hypothetical protein [Neomoorella thermoacetica]|uniref:hypothetical protein n=1 Tax=Neomoorella thermoacetica TaxID=1525 RepID=UPI000908415A|nr:hypothetical protein [Moorella thermoacetica]APC08281.1 hypothetical protein MTJW_11150 [Moorella thermoacetica]